MNGTDFVLLLFWNYDVTKYYTITVKCRTTFNLCRQICSLNVAETELKTEGFSHRLRPYKIVEVFFVRSYRRLGLDDQVANRFIRISNISATWSYAQLICRTFIKKLWAFFGPYRSLWVTAILKKNAYFSWVKQMQQSTAHTFTGWARSRLAVLQLEMYGCVYTYFIETDIYMF